MGATCEWFALCRNESVGTVPHPVLGDVPICQRCADKMELTDRLRPWPNPCRNGGVSDGC